MFRISRFQELLKYLPKKAFHHSVQQRQADKYNKKFSPWAHLVVMIYAQLSGAKSLRHIEAGFNSLRHHQYHLGVGTVRRSTLSDANQYRDVGVFSDLAWALMAQCSQGMPRHSKDLLYLLDSTSVTLKGLGFDRWTAGNRTRNTQGIKLHLLLESQGKRPLWYHLSAPNVCDIVPARDILLERGAVYVFDKGYCDYSWWAKIDQAGACFVTRLKHNAGVRVLTQRPIDPKAEGMVLEDQEVGFVHRHTRAGRAHPYTAPLRRIVVARPEAKTALVLCTNDFDSDALTIAERYRTRWQVELFFKWVKQHLRVKSFLGRSQNAVHIQMLVALIVYMLLVLYKQAHQMKESLWILFCKISASLFERIPLEEAHYRR